MLHRVINYVTASGTIANDDSVSALSRPGCLHYADAELFSAIILFSLMKLLGHPSFKTF